MLMGCLGVGVVGVVVGGLWGPVCYCNGFAASFGSFFRVWFFFGGVKGIRGRADTKATAGERQTNLT